MYLHNTQLLTCFYQTLTLKREQHNTHVLIFPFTPFCYLCDCTSTRFVSDYCHYFFFKGGGSAAASGAAAAAGRSARVIDNVGDVARAADSAGDVARVADAAGDVARVATNAGRAGKQCDLFDSVCVW